MGDATVRLHLGHRTQSFDFQKIPIGESLKRAAEVRVGLVRLGLIPFDEQLVMEEVGSPGAHVEKTKFLRVRIGRILTQTEVFLCECPTLVGKVGVGPRSEEHTSELQSPCNLVCRLLLEKKKRNITQHIIAKKKKHYIIKKK